jgi:hypothetical protein
MTTAGVKVAEVLDAARRGRALLAPEIAGYLVLAAADQVSSAPTVLDENHCGLLVEGGRVVLAPQPPSTAIESERALRNLLRRLLEAANGRAPALSAVANAVAKGNVAVLIAELESALIPVNRSAAGRALSRLARDAVRARVGEAKPAAAPAAGVDGSAAPANGGGGAEQGETSGDDTERMDLPDIGVRASNVDALAVEDHELIDAPQERTSDAPQASAAVPAPTTSSRADRPSGAELDDLLATRVSSAPPPPVTAGASPALDAGRPSSPSASARDVDELIQDFMTTTSRKEERVAADLRKLAGVDGAKKMGATLQAPTPDPSPITLDASTYESPFHNAAGAAELYTATPPPRAIVAQSVTPPPPDEDPLARRSTRRSVYMMLGAVSLLTLGAVTLFRLEPGVLSGRTAGVVDAEKRAAAGAAASIAAKSGAGACRATVIVTDVPAGAEVLVRSGVAPVDVDRVPSGARLEFVALFDGYAPRRGVVPHGVEWDLAAGKPRFELPIQLEKTHAKSGALDPWPATEPGSVVGGQGAPGTVHVVTSPRGAEVWMVAGGAPEAKIESLPCGTGLELLVAGTAQGQPFRRRLRVDAAQVTPEPSANSATARISAK